MSNKNKMKSKMVFGGAFMAAFMHVFCCGIPLALTILSSFGVSIPNIVSHENHKFDLYIFIFSGAILVLSWLIYFRGKQKDSCHCSCHHSHVHDKADKVNRIVLWIATAIYVISVSSHIFYS